MSGARRKTRIGQVVSDKMSKTVVVAVAWQQRHPLYRKSVRRTTRFSAHDESSTCRVGDRVRIEETRPLSKTKRWRVIEVLKRGEELGLMPVEVDTDLEEELRAAAAATALAVQEVAQAAESSEKSDVALDVQAGQQPTGPESGADQGSA